MRVMSVCVPGRYHLQMHASGRMLDLSWLLQDRQSLQIVPEHNNMLCMRSLGIMLLYSSTY